MDGLDWKRIARALTSPLLLLALVALLIWSAKWGYRQVTAPPLPEPIISCSPSPVGTVLKSNQVTINVYNGGRQQGLAGKIARQMKAKGFQVRFVDNTEKKIDHTIIVAASKDDPAAKLVAQQFVKSEIQEDGITDGIVDVMVGNTFAGYQKAAKTQIKVASDPCLPPPSETPSLEPPA